jgi:hypothetical protein
VPSLSRIRRPGAVVVATLAVAALSGCGAGFDATSREPYAPSDGILANAGDMRLINMLVVSGENSREGVVVGTLANRGKSDDRLVAIETPAGTVDLGGGIDLPAEKAVPLSAAADGRQVLISTLSAQPGQALELRFVFEENEPAVLTTVVVPPTGPYETITPSPVTTLSP